MRFGALALFITMSTVLSARSSSTFKLTQTFVLGGEGGVGLHCCRSSETSALHCAPDPPDGC